MKTEPRARRIEVTRRSASKNPRTLPPALVENAQALRTMAQERLRERGEAALGVLRDKLGDLAANIFEIGQALGELAADGVATALGYADFEDACRRALNLGPTTARRWMTLATRLDRRFVLAVGPDRARALMELSDALPRGGTPPEALLARTLTLPTGERVVVKKASNSKLDEVAKAFRQARAPKDPARPTARGFTTTQAEREAHALIARRLAKAPRHAHARSRLVAQRGPDGAKLVIEVRLAAWEEALTILLGKR